MHFYRFIILSLLLLTSHTIADGVKNPFENSYKKIDKNEKVFLSMLQTEHAQHQKAMQLKIEQERLEEEKRLEAIRVEEERLAFEEKLRIEEEARIKLALALAEEKRKRELREKLRKANQVIAHIDISKQRMTVKKGGKILYQWKVSTGRKGHNTPRGTYRPKSMETMHHSRQYNNAPMPYSIFFRGGYAVHGTKSVGRLGRRASHGCVRLRTSNAKKFFSLVRRSGMKNTKIRIVN